MLPASLAQRKALGNKYGNGFERHLTTTQASRTGYAKPSQWSCSSLPVRRGPRTTKLPKISSARSYSIYELLLLLVRAAKSHDSIKPTGSGADRCGRN